MGERGPRISSVDAVALPAVIDAGRFLFGIIESPEETTLVELPLERPERYDAGVVFGDETELRWRRMRHGGFRLVQVDDEGRILPGATATAALVRLPEWDDSRAIVLWGERQGTEPAWFEPRVPRWITEYPPNLGGNRMRIRVVRYRLEDTGGSLQGGGSKDDTAPEGTAIDFGEDPRLPARYLYRLKRLDGFDAQGGGQ